MEEYVAGKKSIKKHWQQQDRIWDKRIFWELKMAN